MGRYTMETKKLGIQVFGAIMESLNLGATHLKEKFEKGMQIIATNSYSPRQDSSSEIGASPHTDYSIITILTQSSSGLQVMDNVDGTWKVVPELKGSLQVFVGDHLEVLSNGVYRSVSHRVIVPSTSKTRLSIASFHGFEIDEIVEPELELIRKEGVKRYKGCSARDLLKLVFSGEKDRPIAAIRSLMENKDRMK